MQINDKGQFVKVPAEDRFWDKVTKTKTCWVWNGKRRKDGYGVIWVGSRERRAHRFSLEMIVGPLSPDKKVLHSCDNPPCVRPEHLSVGTQKDNLLDMRNKDRNPFNRRGTAHPRARFSPQAILAIRQLKQIGTPQREIAELYGVCQQTVSNVITGKRYA